MFISLTGVWSLYFPGSLLEVWWGKIGEVSHRTWGQEGFQGK